MGVVHPCRRSGSNWHRSHSLLWPIVFVVLGDRPLGAELSPRNSRENVRGLLLSLRLQSRFDAPFFDLYWSTRLVWWSVWRCISHSWRWVRPRSPNAARGHCAAGSFTDPKLCPSPLCATARTQWLFIHARARAHAILYYYMYSMDITWHKLNILCTL